MKTATDVIKFHSTELDLSDVHLQTEDGAPIPSSLHSHNKLDSVVILNVSTLLQPGLYKLSVKFNGMLDDNLRGFYRAKYKRYGMVPEAWCFQIPASLYFL